MSGGLAMEATVSTRAAEDPAVIGPYTILGRLGQGGMGTVYLGRTGDGSQAAVKLVRRELAGDADFGRRFAAEVDNARRVASFCTAAVLGHGMFGDRPYLATEYIEGPTLESRLAREGALPPGSLQSLAVGVAAALTAIHAAGLVHRDLKPSNVILSITGPRVIDFGISRSLDALGLTATGIVLGTPGWLAPERLLRGEDAPAADVFTWGCLVACAGTNRHPYGTGDPVALAGRVLHGEPDLDGLPAPLAEIVRTALDRDPAARPAARDLLLTLTGGSVVDPDATRLDLPSAAEARPAPAQPATAKARSTTTEIPPAHDQSATAELRSTSTPVPPARAEPATAKARPTTAEAPPTPAQPITAEARSTASGRESRAPAAARTAAEPRTGSGHRLVLGGLLFALGVLLLVTGVLLLRP
jgi:serine/threonine protein kinase